MYYEQKSWVGCYEIVPPSLKNNQIHVILHPNQNPFTEALPQIQDVVHTVADKLIQLIDWSISCAYKSHMFGIELLGRDLLCF